MARALIQAGLLVLLALALFHISKAEMGTDEEKQLEEKSLGNPESDIEESKWRIVSEAGGKRKKGPTERKSNNRKKKTRKSKNKSIKSKTKSGKNRKYKKKSQKKATERNKKSRKNKNKSRKIKGRSKKNGKGKNTSKSKKKGRKNKTNKNKSKSERKRKGRKISTRKERQTCDVIALCQKIKDYIKISNQLRKVNRIIKSCDTVEKKANKSATEFDATVAALETAIGSRRRLYISKWRRSKRSVDDVTTIKDKLKSCSKTAKALCERSSVPACLETDLLARCKTELGDWVKKFGPAKGSCLKESDDCCACIMALPAVSVDCLDFIAKSESAVKSKNNCTSNSKEGSFGDCRKQQHLAAEKGPAVACGSTAGTVTSGPTAAPTTAAPTTAAPTTAAPTATTAAAASVTTAAAADDSYMTKVKGYIDASTCGTVSANSNCGTAATSYYKSFTYNGKNVIIASQVPDHAAEHDIINPNPNTRCEIWQYIQLPIDPSKGTSSSATSLGTIGLAVTGGAFFNDVASPQGELAMTREGPSLDSCFGHSAPGGSYHYHANINCTSAGAATGANDPTKCVLIGYYRDGVPIYGFCKDTNGVQYTSCYKINSGVTTSTVTTAGGTFSGLGAKNTDYTYDTAAFTAGTCNLDAGNGALHPTTGKYSYFTTYGYPWVPILFFGSEGAASLCSAA